MMRCVLCKILNCAQIATVSSLIVTDQKEAEEVNGECVIALAPKFDSSSTSTAPKT